MWLFSFLKWTFLFLVLLKILNWFKVFDRVLTTLSHAILFQRLFRTKSLRIQLNLTQGYLCLKHVDILPSAVDVFDLPFQCRSAMIDLIEIRIPWFWWRTGKGIGLTVSGVHVTGSCRKYPTSIPPETHSETLCESKAAIRRSLLRTVELILWDDPIDRLTYGEAWSKSLSDVALHYLLQQLSICFSEISFTFIYDKNCRETSQSDASILELFIRGFEFHSDSDSVQDQFNCDCHLNGFSIRVYRQGGEASRILHQWCWQSRILWRRARDEDAADDISIKTHCNALLLSLTDDTIVALAEMAIDFVEYGTFVRHRCHRPQVPVVEDPIKWWKHAGQCVVDEISRVCSMRRFVKRMDRRRAYRQQYDTLYQNYRRVKRWSWILIPIFGTEQSALQELQRFEEGLSTMEVAEFRWWTWILRNRGKGEYISQEHMQRKLLEIYNLLSVDTEIMENASKWRFDVTIECPKVSILLGLDNSTSLLVCLREIKFDLASGASENAKYQRASGLFSTGLSCLSLEISHERSGKKHPHGVSGRRRDSTREDDEAWIIRSPPQLRERGQRRQFLDVKYIEPELSDVSHRDLKIWIAPIDLSYVEKSILKVATFVASMATQLMIGTGDQELDLQLRIEEVTGEADANLKRVAPVHQLALEAAVGDVRVIAPCRRGMPTNFHGPRVTRALKHLNTMRRSKGSTYRLTSDQPLLVLVLSGFSMKTRIDEWEEAIQNTITLNDSIAAREQMLNKNDAETTSPRLSDPSVLSTEDLTEELEMTVRATQRRFSRKLSVQFTFQAFLGDPFAPGEMIFHHTIELLSPVTIEAICNSHIESISLNSLQHVMRVQLHMSSLQCFVSPLTLFELSQVVDSLAEVQAVMIELYAALLKPSEESLDGSRNAVPMTDISSCFELSLRFPVLTVTFCHVFSFAEDVKNADCHLGHVTVHMLEVMAVSDDCETDINFVIRRMEVVLDNILSSTSMHSPSTPSLRLPFTVLKPMPAALVPTLMTQRKLKLRTFQEWRRCVKEKRSSSFGQRSENGLFNQLQLAGRVFMTEHNISASLTGTFLVLALDNQAVDVCVAYCQEIIKFFNQLDEEIVEIKKHANGTPLASTPSTLSALQRTTTLGVTEKQPCGIQLDFGFGCVRLCASVNGQQLSTVSATNIRGKIEQEAEIQATLTASAQIEDIILIDHAARSALYQTVLDGNVDEKDDVLDENCQINIGFESTPTGTQIRRFPLAKAEDIFCVVEPSCVPAMQRRSTNSVDMSRPDHEPTQQESIGRRNSLHVTISRLRLTYISRFIKDWEYFLQLAILRYLQQPASSASVSDDTAFTMDLVLKDYRLIIPRSPSAEELYAITGEKGRIVVPVSLEYVEHMKSVMQSEASDVVCTFDLFWKDMLGVTTDPPEPSSHATHHPPDTNDCDFASNYALCPNDADRLLISLEKAKIEWGYRRDDGETLRRCVLDGGNILIAMKGVETEIFCPAARCVMGDVQFSLMMDILEKNYSEECSFVQEPAPMVRPGDIYPLPSSSPEALGILNSEIPTLEVRVYFQRVAFLLETPIEQSLLYETLGVGRKEAEVFFDTANVTYTCYDTGSKRLHVISKGAALHDVRQTQDDGTCIALLSIDPRNSGDGSHLTRIVSRSRSRWSKVWETVQPDQSTAETTPSIDDHEPVNASGFIFDFVQQQRGENVAAGPTVMEVILLNADLIWPYCQDLSFLDGLSDAFNTYFKRPTASVYRDNPGPDEWTYINCIFKNSQLTLPLSAATATQKHVPLNFAPIGEGMDGFGFGWESFRVGYYWGGDGETRVQLDLRSFSVDWLERLRPDRKVCIAPFAAAIAMRMHSPKQAALHEDIHIKCSFTEICWKLHIKKAKLIQKCIQRIQSLMKTATAVESNSSQEKETKRLSLIQCRVEGEGIKLQLEDDREPSTVVGACISPCQLDYRSEQRAIGTPVQSSAEFSGRLEVVYMNDALDTMDPFVENWGFSLEYLDNGVRKSVTINSPNRINILATPAVIPPLAEVLTFARKCTAMDSIARFSSRCTALNLARKETETGKYKLVNESGVPLNYWVDSRDSTTHPEKYQVMPNTEEYLKVRPVTKPVHLPHANTKIQTRTICLLFAGNWNELEDIVVDKVGKYVYELKSPHTHYHVNVIVDVTVDGHTKVITAHSVFRVVNGTDRRMRLLGNFISEDDSDVDVNDKEKGRVVIRHVPAHGYLAPDAQTYLPLIPCTRVLLNLKVSTFNKTEKDLIQFDASGKKLLQQQGMYTCLPYQNGSGRFHCCLEVQEASIKSQDSTVTGARAEVQEYTLIFHPALTMQNLLPFPVNLELYAVEAHATRPHDLLLGQGESLPVYDFDLTRSVKYKASFSGGFQIAAPVDLKPSRKTRRVTTDSDRVVRFTHSPSGTSHGDHTRHLDLRLKEAYIGLSGARKVTLYSPYWIANRTNRQIRVKDRKSNSFGQVTAKPRDDDFQSGPVLFSSSKAMAFLSVADISWSRGINLNSVGLKDAVTVLAPAEEEIQSEEATTVYPHGVVTVREPTAYKSFTQMFSPHSIIESRPPLLSHSSRDLFTDDEEEAVETKTRGPRFERLDFAVSVQMGSGEFDLIKVLKISPRYILYNNSKDRLLIGQKRTTKAITLNPEEMIDYYWHDSEEAQEICVKPLVGTWYYSGGFRLNQVNDFGLRIRHARREGFDRILQVDVSLKGDSMICAFCNDDNYPPYRIENKSACVKIQFKQKGATRLSWDTVLSLDQKDYAWDYPLLAHRLKVKVICAESGVEDETVREYSLDAIKTYPAFWIRPKSRSLRTELGDRGQRRASEAELVGKVYVRVFAEGPTRIIRFSDVDESVYDATNEQAFEILKSKRDQLVNDIDTVRSKLKVFESAHGIDMDLMYTHSVAVPYGRGDPLPASISEEPQFYAVPSMEPSTSRPIVQAGQDIPDTTHTEAETASAIPFFRRPLIRGAIKTLSCGLIVPVKPTLMKTAQRNPAVQHTELQRSAHTPRMSTGFLSPFEQQSPALSTSEITEAGSIESLAPSPFCQRPAYAPSLQKTSTMTEKLEEWADPSLSELTQRLIRRQTLGGGVLVEEPELEDSQTGQPQMLGGELIVKVHGAKDLGKGRMMECKRTDSFNKSILLTRFSSMKKLNLLTPDSDVYCVLKCGGKEEKTPKAQMASKIKWEKIISFPAVAVDSYLTVTVRAKGLLSDSILGEVFIPLADISERAQIDTADSKLYSLSRDNASTQVRGSIELSIGWRTTPLDRLTLHVRDLQQELDDLEELLAMMTAKENPDQDRILLSQVYRSRSDSWSSRSPVGKLEVKVMEARNLAIPVERLKRSFANSGIYATVTCERETGKGMTYTTATSKNGLAPQWKDTFKYDDVHLTSTLTIQLYDVRRMRTNEFLGLRHIDVHSLKDGKPHYCWLPLEESPEARGRRVSGEVHLRVRWLPNSAHSVNSSLDSGLSINMTLSGFGISLIEASATKLPRELMHVFLDEVSFQYDQRGPDESAQLRLRSMQIDNQLITSLHPVVFAHSRTAVNEKRDLIDDDKAQTETKPVLEVRLEKTSANPKLLHIRYFTFLLQEIDLVLEEDFLDLLLQWFEDLPLDKLQFSDDEFLQRQLNEAEIDRFVNKLMRRRDLAVEFTESHTRGLRCYLEVLHIQPIKVNITLLASPAFAANGHSKRYRAALAMGLNLLDLTNFPLKINAMMMNNAFMRPREVIAEVMRHMKWQAAYSLHKILGTVELIGTTVQLSNSIVTGVASFFYEPAKGIVHGPEEFARGVATGTVHLIKNSMYGVFNTFGNVTEGMGKTLAKLSLDDNYYQRYQNKPRTTKEKMIEGTRMLSWSVIHGVTGIVTDPMTGASEDGFRGFTKGVMTGVAGVITKPVSGVLHFAGSMASGIGENIMEIGDKMDREQRVRICPPRDFGIRVGADVAEAQLHLWKKTLTDTQPDAFQSDNVTNFVRQDKQVLIITDQHLIFMNFVKKKVIWVLDLQSVISVECTVLDVSIQFTSEHRMGRIVGPARKRITCRTRETQHQLLDKIHHAIKTYKRTTQEPKQLTPTKSAPVRRQTLRIMHKAPPSPLGRNTDPDDRTELVTSTEEEEENGVDSSEDPSVSVSRFVPTAESSSGPSLIQTLKSLTQLSDGVVRHYSVETLQRTLVHIHEAVISTLSHVSEGNSHRSLLLLVRDLTQTSVLADVTSVQDLVSVYATVRAIADNINV